MNELHFLECLMLFEEWSFFYVQTYVNTYSLLQTVIHQLWQMAVLYFLWEPRQKNLFQTPISNLCFVTPQKKDIKNQLAVLVKKKVFVYNKSDSEFF